MCYSKHFLSFNKTSQVFWKLVEQIWTFDKRLLISIEIPLSIVIESIITIYSEMKAIV